MKRKNAGEKGFITAKIETKYWPSEESTTRSISILKIFIAQNIKSDFRLYVCGIVGDLLRVKGGSRYVHVPGPGPGTEPDIVIRLDVSLLEDAAAADWGKKRLEDEKMQWNVWGNFKLSR